MRDSYEADLAAFRSACAEWSSLPGPMIEATPPAVWSAYRSLQGSGFAGVDRDPNPSRRVVDAVRGLEEELVRAWLLSETPQTLDLASDVGGFLARLGMRCSDPSDLAYLGFLLAGQGWVDPLRPLFRECLRRYLGGAPSSTSPRPSRAIVTLEPPAVELRSLLARVSPCSAATWSFRLSSRSGHDAGERSVIEEVRRSLAERPLRFSFEES